MRVTMVIKKDNEIHAVITDNKVDAALYENWMEWARKGEARWGWRLVTMETEKGYREVIRDWEREHR